MAPADKAMAQRLRYLYLSGSQNKGKVTSFGVMARTAGKSWEKAPVLELGYAGGTTAARRTAHTALVGVICHSTFDLSPAYVFGLRRRSYGFLSERAV